MYVNEFTKSLAGKKILVCGLARSGAALAKALAAVGARVSAADEKPAPEAAPELSALGIKLYLGQNPDAIITDFDIIALSPGIPADAPFAVKARASGVFVTGEFGLAAGMCQAPIYAVTGTNGKTTTTALLGEIMSLHNSDTFVVGNIGAPFAERALRIPPEGAAVAEVSTFQLETAAGFAPKISAVLNVTPDHLNRHGTMENYIALKESVFRNQGEDGYTVLNADDGITLAMAAKTKAKAVLFSRRRALAEGVWLDDGGTIRAALPGVTGAIVRVSELNIFGSHNYENVMAAAAMAICAGAPAETIRRALRGFRAVPHRIEFTRELDGVKYFNDSKATNVDAAIKGIEAFSEPVIVIGGGRAKTGDFSAWVSLFPGRVKHCVVIGEASDLIISACAQAGFPFCHRASSMEDAVIQCRELAEPGDRVLLSPACASFDMYGSYEERGDAFKAIVNALDTSWARP
ncbi:MAG: UDP-N-acetylmuramoyl-L-alanine--D-glutamate ligase [Clostridiales bacterium]|jgi:UDP-N-acetylmuramoylalanine--D-glutamate ligase|nr:UDP-N-acetylmuramoyl-L-alanine--D-glutamate ligase [Clostridiales bacterium]